MDYYDSISRAIDYVELHLKENLSLHDIAAQAYLSVSHFYRIFPAMTGCTVGQYIRRRRLSEAVYSLRGGKRILDIALEYQFESQESFSRAFKAMFNITPGKYRENPILIPLYHPARLRKNEKGEIFMHPEIILKQFTLLGIETQVDLNTDFTAQIIGLTNAFQQRISEIQSTLPPLRIINMWYPQFNSDSPTSEPVTIFFTGVEVSRQTTPPGGMVMKTFPESLYAVFLEKQRGIIGGPEGYAYKTWIPNSGYLLNDRIPGDLEEYADTVHVGYEDLCKIWIPICPAENTR